MPKSKEYISSSDDSSGEDVKPKKKQKKETNEEEKPKSSKKSKPERSEQEETIWDLGNNRQVTVRDFKGKLYVDIREMYYDKEGSLKPGKKGICLNMSQWRKLLAVVEDVDKAVKAKS